MNCVRFLYWHCVYLFINICIVVLQEVFASYSSLVWHV